jgi:rod shape-determining protein MreB
LAERIEDVVKMRVWIAEDSMTCVARGAGRVLEDLDNYKRVLVGLDRGSTHH